MARGVMAAVLVLGLLAGRAGAAELTGFGPIKFGMTKEAAVAALEAAGIEGKWKNEHKLVYELPIHGRTGLYHLPEGSVFEVTQAFMNNRAIDAYPNAKWDWAARPVCLSHALYFVSIVKNKYNKEPIVIHDTGYGRYIGKQLKRTDEINSFEDIFVFDFKGESLVSIILAGSYFEDSCSLIIWYHPPVPNPMPF